MINVRSDSPVRRLALVCSLLPALALTLAVVGFGTGNTALAAPEPSPVPKRWQLDLDVGPLRLMTVEVPGEGYKRFLYLTYTVTNHSGQDLLLAPAWDLATTDGKVHRSGRDVSGRTWRTILDRLNNPLLNDQIEILGLILQGVDNAKQGLVVWPADGLDLENFRIYAAGFSGEFHRLTLEDPKTGEEVEKLLRKTLMARYAIPGEVYDRGADEIPLINEQWIMR